MLKANERLVDDQLIVMDYASPRISSEVYECGLPLTFDQYNKCAFNCQYCFAAFIANAHAQVGAASEEDAKKQSKYRNPVHSVNPERVKRYWTEMHSNHWRRSDAMIVNLLRRRTPLHWGGLCDPFDPFEKRFRVGLELLQFFREWDWPVLFSTKGTLMMESPWADVLRGGNFRFQFSITTLDPAKGKVSDSGVASPQGRLAAMRFVTKELGCVATLRLRPIIPGFVSPAECVELIRQAHANGATGVSTEFFCMEARGKENREKYERMSAAVGFDLFEFYRRNSPGQSGYLRLNRAIKGQWFLPMARIANELGMRFSVSDMAYKELGNVDGCCGSFWNDEGEKTRDGRDGVFINKGTLTYALIHARKHGKVTWSDVAPTLEWARANLDANIGGLMDKTPARLAHRRQTLFDALRSNWNDPNDHKSPYRYSGGKVVPTTLDANGDVIYVYKHDDFDNDETVFSAAPGCGAGGGCGTTEPEEEEPGERLVPVTSLVRR